MGPLSGFKIIEMAGIGPLPFGAMMLADMGAEVISIERKAGIAGLPPVDPTLRNRRSISINLKDPQGLQLLLQLCDGADALLEGYRPGVAERLGFGPDVLLQRNPKLVFGRMTGWGQTGPLAQAAGHDINYLALSGALEKMGRAGEKPAPPLNLVGDYGGGGMFLAFGVVCALLEAQKSGKGQVVDAAMVDGAATLMAFLYSFEKNPFYRQFSERGKQLFGGNNHFYNTYETADGKFLSVGALEANFYFELLHRIGMQDTDIQEQWLGSAQMDIMQFPAMEQKLQAIFLRKTRDEWCALLEGSDACVAPVLTIAEAPQHPHNLARGTFIQQDGYTQHAPAPRFSRTATEMPSSVKVAGADTRQVLQGLGISGDAIDTLKSQGVIDWPA